MLGPLAGCSSSGPASGGTSSTTGSTRPSGPPDWSTLASMLSGQLVLPATPSYPTNAELYNEKFDGASPAAIAYCRTASDVQRCVGFARAHAVPMAARSGGHSYGGYSSGPGLVIDVTQLDAVVVGGAATATVGAGARLIDVYSTLGASGSSSPAVPVRRWGSPD